MLKRSLILFFPCAFFLVGCGIKGPLYLPPNPNDSYLSRIGQQINEMTGQDTVGAPPPDTEERAQEQTIPAAGESDQKAPARNVETVSDPLRSTPENPLENTQD